MSFEWLVSLIFKLLVFCRHFDIFLDISWFIKIYLISEKVMSGSLFYFLHFGFVLLVVIMFFFVFLHNSCLETKEDAISSCLNVIMY